MRKSRKMATLLNTDSAKASSKLESDKEDNGNCQPEKAVATSKLSSTGDGDDGANCYIRSDASLLEMERVTWILAHRNMLQQGVLIFGSPLFNSHTKVFMTFSAPDNKSKPVKNIESLKPIYVNDINKLIEDKSYCNFKGTIIKLMSIDDASVGQQSTRLVVEDGNKSTYRLIIYNYPYDSCPKQPSPENVAIIQRNLGFGSVISIMNPYVKRCAYDAEAYLRVEDSSTLIYHREESKVNRCRYCYKPEADYRCSLCRRHYCSRICQKKDWKINQHKLICGIKFREL